MAPTNKEDLSEVYTLLIGLSLLCLIVALMIAGLLRLADAMAPQVGDIVSFKHVESIGSVAQAHFIARRVGSGSAAHCTLDEGIMRALGGSIVIEARQEWPQRTYRVHWAGTHTSNGEADCGTSADLVLDRVEMVALMYAAGT